MALINLDKDNIGSDQLRDTFIPTQKVLMPVTQYSQRIREVQIVCEHPPQNIDLQRQITDPPMRQFLPPQRDHTELKHQILTLRNERDETLRIPLPP
jgi:hypothetical protein